MSHKLPLSVLFFQCFFFSPCTDDFTEDLLNQHEDQVKILKKYYEDHQELFEGVTKWQDNWTLYLELDVSTVLVLEFSVKPV